MARDIASSPQTKIGIRLIDIPGARIFRMVTMKLMAPPVDEIAVKMSPRA